MNSLEERFKSFILGTQFIQAEDIDLIKLPQEFSGSKKADYLCFNRKVIVELKTLKTDPSPKVTKELDKHQSRDDYPLFYWKTDLQQILSHLPDGKEINDRIYRNITRSIEDEVRGANKQILATKEAFNLEDSIGLLVVLNENIEILSPEIVGRRLSELLCKKGPDNTLSYNNIQYIWLIAESHFVPMDKEGQAFVSALIISPGAEENSWFLPVFNEFQIAWAAYNHVLLIYSDEKRIDNFLFKSTHSSSKMTEDNTDTISGDWRLKYQKDPYLRKLTDEEVYQFGRRVLDEMAPHFLVDGHRLPSEKINMLMMAWTGFLEEACFRGLDLKKINLST